MTTSVTRPSRGLVDELAVTLGAVFGYDLRISSPYGQRQDPTFEVPTPEFHRGIDIPAPEGTPVQAVQNGHIVRIDDASTGTANGNAIFLKGADNYRYCYLHLSRVDVRVGDPVLAGDELGAVGQTGKATGPHLHFQVYDPAGETVDPLTLYPAGTFDVR